MHGANHQHRTEERNQNNGRIWLRSGRHRGITLILPILVSVILTTVAIPLVCAGLSDRGDY
jgi:hypothetical protein